MNNKTTITGLVATTPRHLITADGLAITSFRIACATQKFDRATMKWIDADTNWYTITSFRTLATNVSTSISKGDRVIVSGDIRVRDWDNGTSAGTSVEIEAETIGHDLAWGTTNFTRTTSVSSVSPKEEPSIV